MRVTPYLQFGEVQWWYFAAPSGMPFTTITPRARFKRRTGGHWGPSRARMRTPPHSPTSGRVPADPHRPIHECDYGFRAAIPCGHALRGALPAGHERHTPEQAHQPSGRGLDSGKAGLFQDRKLHLYRRPGSGQGAANPSSCLRSLVFSPSESSHLVGIGDYTTPWARERRLALGEGKK